jgi:hypothetical protein
MGRLIQTERCAHEYYGDICGVVSFEQDGKVCLSLLGTWPGPSWQADGTSTLLQVSTHVEPRLLHLMARFWDIRILRLIAPAFDT